MANITEKDLIELGFNKEQSTDMVSDEPAFYYYTYGKYGLLISSANDELINGEFWYVEILEHPDFSSITDLETLKELISILNKISN